jgi:hypothetical protein
MRCRKNKKKSESKSDSDSSDEECEPEKKYNNKELVQNNSSCPIMLSYNEEGVLDLTPATEMDVE